MSNMRVGIRISASSAEAKASLAETTQGIRAIGTEAKESGAKIRANLQPAEVTAFGRAAAQAANDMLKVSTATQKAADTQAKLNQAIGVRTDFGTNERAADIEEYGRRLDGLRAKYVPLFAIEQQHQSVLAEISDAQRFGAISAKEAEAAIGRETEAYRRQVEVISGARFPRAVNDNTKSLAAMGQQTGLTRNQVLTLQYTINDVAASLASGASPFTILLQQGGQVTQAFGGITGTLRALLTPATATAGGLAALAAVMALGITRAEMSARSLKDFEVDLRATGRQSDLSARQLVNLADELKNLPGVSKAAGIAIVSAFTGSRQIGGGMISELSTLTVDYARAMKQEMPEAAAALAKAFADPMAGAKALEEQFGFLSLQQLRMIEQLQRSGDRVGAQRTLYDALNARLKGLASDGMTEMQRGADSIGKSWGAMLDKLGQTSTIQAARDAVIGFLDGVGRAVTPKTAGGRSQDRQGQIAGIERDLADFRANGLTDRDPEIASRQAILQRLRREEADAARSALNAMRAGEYSSQAGLVAGTMPQSGPPEAKVDPTRTKELLDQFTPLAAQKRALEDTQAFLQRARSEADPASQTYRELSEAINRVQAAYAALKTPAEQAAEQTRIEAEVLKAPIAERDALRARLQAEYQARQAGEPAAQATRIGLEAEKQARLQLGDAQQQQLDALDRETASLKAVAQAYAEGNPAKAKAIEVDREAEQLTRQLGISMDQARSKIKARADATMEAAAAQDLLNRKLDTDAMLRLGQAERGGNRNDIRDATIRNAGDAYERQFPGQPGRADAEADAARRYDESVRNSANATRLATDAAEARRQSLERLNEELRSGALTESQAAIARARIDEEYRRSQVDNLLATKDFTSGATAAWMDFTADLADGARTGYRLMSDFLDGTAKGLADMTMGMKSAGAVASDFLRNLGNDLLQLFYKQQVLGPLSNAIMGSGGSGGGIISSLLSSIGIFHDGGVVGRSLSSRQAPASWFLGAPRYHGGGIIGLQPNERPVIALEGEEVLTERDPRHIRNLKNGGMAAAPIVNIQVINNTSGKVQQRTEQRPRQDGGVDVTTWLDEWAKDSVKNGAIAEASKQPSLVQRG